jgi:hypothetical protein
MLRFRLPLVRDRAQRVELAVRSCRIIVTAAQLLAEALDLCSVVAPGAAKRVELALELLTVFVLLAQLGELSLLRRDVLVAVTTLIRQPGELLLLSGNALP